MEAETRSCVAAPAERGARIGEPTGCRWWATGEEAVPGLAVGEFVILPAISNDDVYVLVKVTRMGAKLTSRLGVHIYGPGAGIALPGWWRHGPEPVYSALQPQDTLPYTDRHSQLLFTGYSICVAGVKIGEEGLIPVEVMDWALPVNHRGR